MNSQISRSANNGAEGPKKEYLTKDGFPYDKLYDFLVNNYGAVSVRNGQIRPYIKSYNPQSPEVQRGGVPSLGAFIKLCREYPVIEMEIRQALADSKDEWEDIPLAQSPTDMAKREMEMVSALARNVLQGRDKSPIEKVRMRILFAVDGLNVPSLRDDEDVQDSLRELGELRDQLNELEQQRERLLERAMNASSGVKGLNADLVRNPKDEALQAKKQKMVSELHLVLEGLRRPAFGSQPDIALLVGELEKELEALERKK